MRITGVVNSVQHNKSERYGDAVWLDVEGLSVNISSAILGGRTYIPGDIVTVEAALRISKTGKPWLACHHVPSNGTGKEK